MTNNNRITQQTRPTLPVPKCVPKGVLVESVGVALPLDTPRPLPPVPRGFWVVWSQGLDKPDVLIAVNGIKPTPNWGINKTNGYYDLTHLPTGRRLSIGNLRSGKRRTVVKLANWIEERWGHDVSDIHANHPEIRQKCLELWMSER